MFVKYANVVEVARNAKIDIKHYGNLNCVSYGGIVNNKHTFRIQSASPNVKGIEKFVGIIHELSHILFQTPFDASKKLLVDHWGLKGEMYELFFNAFNVLEDQRIESQMGKMYLKHKGRFDKTTKKLGKLMNMSDMIDDNPVNMLLAIRFQRGKDIKHLKNFDVYDKALKDVILTDKYGALRVLVSIKPYIDEWIHMKNQEQGELLSKQGMESEDEKSRLREMKLDSMKTRSMFCENDLEDVGDVDDEVPEELQTPSMMTNDEVDEMLDESKEMGKSIVSDIFESLKDDGNFKRLPKNLRMVKRYEENVYPDYKLAKGMSKVFRALMMRHNEFIDYDGDEIDVESYVEGVIRGNDIGKCRVNQKITHGVSIVVSIDGSHSMNDNHKMVTARKLVATMFESIKNIDNVEMKANVWGGNTYGRVGMTEINNANDVKYLSTSVVGGTYFTTPVHMALEYSGDMLKRMKGSKKMMIIITDGVPNHFNNKYHISMDTYIKSCKKSMLKAMNVTPNIMCIVVQNEYSYRYNPIKTLFKGTKIMNVTSMNKASERVIKSFKRMVMKSLV